jgi:GNAT superfamily N-acetyltransferase
MKVVELKTKEELLTCYPLIILLYPELSLLEYEKQLDIMLPHNYSMLAVYDEGHMIGLSGVWLGNKLWCGKYMELDNVVVAKDYRSKGVGAMLFDYAKKLAKQNNCNSIGLDSFTYNHASHKFFFKEEFIVKGYHFVHVLDDKNGFG